MHERLLNDPKILILDEPTVGLNPNKRIRFKNLLSNISKDKIILFSVRVIGEKRPVAEAILQLPNLEDVFLYFFGEHVK